MKVVLNVLLGSVAAGFLLSSCESVPEPSRSSLGTVATASAPGSASPDGRKLYYGRCTSCHAADPIGDHTRSEWHRIIAEMAPKAKLSGAERSAVLAYVLAQAGGS